MNIEHLYPVLIIIFINRWTCFQQKSGSIRLYVCMNVSRSRSFWAWTWSTYIYVYMLAKKRTKKKESHQSFECESIKKRTKVKKRGKNDRTKNIGRHCKYTFMVYNVWNMRQVTPKLILKIMCNIFERMFPKNQCACDLL